MSTQNMNRRAFLQSSLTVAAAGSMIVPAPYISAQNGVASANDRIRVAVVGVNARGKSHIKEFGKMKNVEIAALVDVDQNVLEKQAEAAEKQFGRKPAAFQDLRKALEMKDIDVVSIATTNHTHAILSIWSIQAGKDVYVEKPCEHNLFEGRKLVEATNKYKRIVQHGTQSRSSDARARLIAAVQSGKYGKLRIAKGYCCKPRWTIGFQPIEEPPKTLDFDLWLGPAKMQPYHRNLVHYNWHWFWDFGNGDIGNQGVHEMDLCRWGCGKLWPKTVQSFGARYVDEPQHGFKDQGETPNMQLTLYEFDDCALLFETRGLVGGTKTESAKKWKNQVDVEFYTDQGVLRGDQFYPNGSTKGEKIDVAFEKPKPGGHFVNFMNCVRDRNRSNLNADIAVGHPSAAYCQFGNISQLLGKDAGIDTIRRSFGEEPIIQKSIDSITQNLVDALPELENPVWTLGPKLQFDGSAQKFVNRPDADKLLTREYRAPFVVPEDV